LFCPDWEFPSFDLSVFSIVLLSTSSHRYQLIALPILVTVFFDRHPPIYFYRPTPLLLATLSLPEQGFNLYAEISAITLKLPSFD
jgi:hypothetical protein